MKKLILIVLIVGASKQMFAQHELGISLGTAHLLGDFGGGPGDGTIFLKDLDIQTTRPAVGIFYRYNFAKFLSARAQFKYGQLYSNDLFSEESSRFARGLASSSHLFDGSLQLEFNIIPLNLCSGNERFSPYIATGIGFTSVNSTVSTTNAEGIPSTESQYIQPGQVFAVNIPITAGVKYVMKRNLIFALEASCRVAFTDKLDAYVRQENDHFFFVSATVSYVFCKGSKDSQGKCPTFY